MPISEIGAINRQSLNAIEPIEMTIQSVAPSDGFSSHLVNAIGEINQSQVNATKKAQLFTQETPGVELSDVMVDSQKATISLQFAVQVRNKLVTAYQEIMNMQI